MTTTPEHAKRHSPLPWHQRSADLRKVLDANGMLVCVAGCTEPYHDSQIEDAALIVNRVNAHDELVGALQEALALLKDCRRNECLGETGDMETMDRARAALAKAGK